MADIFYEQIGIRDWAWFKGALRRDAAEQEKINKIRDTNVKLAVD